MGNPAGAARKRAEGRGRRPWRRTGASADKGGKEGGSRCRSGRHTTRGSWWRCAAGRRCAGISDERSRVDGRAENRQRWRPVGRVGDGGRQQVGRTRGRLRQGARTIGGPGLVWLITQGPIRGRSRVLCPGCGGCCGLSAGVAEKRESEGETGIGRFQVGVAAAFLITGERTGQTVALWPFSGRGLESSSPKKSRKRPWRKVAEWAADNRSRRSSSPHRRLQIYL